MNTKLVIPAALIVAVLVVYFVSRPEEATAPVPLSTNQTEQGATEETPITGQIELPQSGEQNQNTGTVPQGSGQAQAPVVAKPYVQPATLPLPYSVTVVYDGGRFIPDKVTIIEGGTVRFVNVSTEKMWIASDNHPTHTRYPVSNDSNCLGSSFDQCKAIGKGLSWSFAFTEVGTWGYHNHERARDTGSVTVMTKEKYLEAR